MLYRQLTKNVHFVELYSWMFEQTNNIFRENNYILTEVLSHSEATQYNGKYEEMKFSGSFLKLKSSWGRMWTD